MDERLVRKGSDDLTDGVEENETNKSSKAAVPERWIAIYNLALCTYV